MKLNFIFMTLTKYVHQKLSYINDTDFYIHQIVHYIRMLYILKDGIQLTHEYHYIHGKYYYIHQKLAYIHEIGFYINQIVYYIHV